MDEVASTPRSPKPIFTFAAWFSLLGPLLAASITPSPTSARHSLPIPQLELLNCGNTIKKFCWC